jgi:hypothetical protein
LEDPLELTLHGKGPGIRLKIGPISISLELKASNEWPSHRRWLDKHPETYLLSLQRGHKSMNWRRGIKVIAGPWRLKQSSWHIGLIEIAQASLSPDSMSEA